MKDVPEVRADARDPDVRQFHRSPTVLIYAAAILAAVVLALTGTRTDDGIFVLGRIPFAFVLFVLVLMGVAFFHHYTLYVALAGVVVVTAYTAAFRQSVDLPHHFTHELEVTLINLGGLLVGFALLAKFFEHSGIPDNLPRLLPKNSLWNGFVLLAIVWFISSFLDNIAAAMIGGVMARAAYKGRVSVGYVAAIVAASNAGGAWSVLGDTTTTMMWLDRVRPLDVAHGIIASVVALLCFGFVASARQNKVQAMELSGFQKVPIDWMQVLIVALILGGAIFANFMFTGPWSGFYAGGPWWGVWAAILVGSLLRKPAWGEIPGAAKGALFLLSLVWCASLMPVKSLPPSSWQVAFGLGWVSAVFDNIPLTKLALLQGDTPGLEYDWGMLAFTVGFGGSMIWFGSSAGVAISKDFPQARSTARYLKEGWPVVVAYVVGFFALLLTYGWHPTPKKAKEAPAPAPVTAPAREG
jgi:Na+/H+ antiporter NhaD/arsenite permease-like protein